MFNALVVDQTESGVVATVKSCQLDELSEGETLIKVSYSAVNYKDALGTIERGGVIRSYPMIPGIDLSGVIVETTSDDLKVGQEVVVTGNGTGVSHTGGFSQMARVPNEWVLPLPSKMSMKGAATIGTAGITAMSAIDKLERVGMTPENAPTILVTGATGGVGSMAIKLLTALSYTNVIALTRKESTHDYLTQLGAGEILSPADIEPEKPRPLQKQRFDYVIDTVGGQLISTIIPQVQYNGALALCGNAGGIKMETTVLPFILRGVSIVGIDSVQLSNDDKCRYWERMSKVLDEETLNHMVTSTNRLEDVLVVTESLLKGTHTGRAIVEL